MQTVTKPDRIAFEIREVLSALPFVRRIAVFGSLATATADDWSDIDMMVACEDPWAAAQAIVAAKPIIYFRQFSVGGQPSGRYFFDGESLLNRLDISFHSVDEYEGHFAEPERFGHEITLREIYAGESVEDCRVEHPRAQPFFTPAGEEEERIGSWIYFSLRAIKYTLRTGRPLEKDIPRLESLRDILPVTPRDAVMNGGRIGELAHQAWEMVLELNLF